LIGIKLLKIELMKTKIFFMIAALAIFSFSSCTKEPAIDEASLNLADDDAVIDAVYEDVFNTVDNADIILDNLQKGDAAKSVIAADSCPLVTIDHPTDAIWPKTITIDFGSGCEGLYENTRAGKIIIVVTGPRMKTGSTKTVTFYNYFFNGIKVEGTKELENIGFNDNQHLVMSVTLTGGKLTLPDGKTIERSFEHQREWLAGLLTRNIWDDECLITGTATGVNIKGIAYTNTITTPLHWKRVCRFVVSGVVKIEREGREPIEINYGTGDCDAVATVTMGGETKEITLKFKHRLWGIR
jgi:hypothetical protein